MGNYYVVEEYYFDDGKILVAVRGSRVNGESEAGSLADYDFYIRYFDDVVKLGKYLKQFQDEENAKILFGSGVIIV